MKPQPDGILAKALARASRRARISTSEATAWSGRSAKLRTFEVLSQQSFSFSTAGA
jgi:hypothetical protein